MNFISLKKKVMPVFILITIIFSFLLIGLFFGKAYAYKTNKADKCIYTTNPVIYAVYLKAEKKPITKKDIITYIKIANPAEYMHDRYNPILWNRLFRKDKAKLEKLMAYVNSAKCFKESIDANLGVYMTKKQGFYLMYLNTDKTIADGMKTHRNINFIKPTDGHIYYFFHNLTVTHVNAGDFNFLSVPENKAEIFLNKRTGTFGNIDKSVYLEYNFVPLTGKNNILKVKITSVRVYGDKSEKFLLGIIK